MTGRAALLGLLFTSFAGAGTSTAPVTFYKHVLPVLQKNCQGCHRSGEAAPMQFTSYESTRPWAKAIRAAALTKKMPPWLADPHYGHFTNTRGLTQSEIDTLVKWADTGAVAGDPKDAPKPVDWLEGWNIGKPDAVIEMPVEFAVPASGTIEYNYVLLPTGFTEDKWVQAAEVRPGNRTLVHHVIAFLRDADSPWLKDAKVGVPFVPERRSARRNPPAAAATPAAANGSAPGARSSEQAGGQAETTNSELLVGYAPGMEAATWKSGQAKLVKAGSYVVFQLHYTANGTPGTDRTKIGLVFAKEPPRQRVYTMNATNARFVIPPGDGNHRVDSQITLKSDSTLVSLMPHMHLRGKDFEYTAIYPSGERETLLKVPRYDFNWQLFYYLAEPKLLPKGTRIECVAHFDNSPNNPANPDASKEVRWGDQSWEEMMIGWFEVAIEPDMNPRRLTREDKPAASGPAE